MYSEKGTASEEISPPLEVSDGNWEICLDQRFTSQLSGKKN